MDKLTKSARTYLRMVADLPWPPNMSSQPYRDTAAYLRSLHLEFGTDATRTRITQLRAQREQGCAHEWQATDNPLIDRCTRCGGERA